MGKDEDIRCYSAAELREHRAREGSKTDAAKVLAMTEEELERQIAADPDWRDIPVNWYEHAIAVFPMSDGKLRVQLDADVVNWFRQQGPDYQLRMNDVLKAFVEQQKRA